MKKLKKLSANSPFITNHQLIEWVRNKSSRNLNNVSVAASCNPMANPERKKHEISLIPKKTHNVSENTSIMSNFEK